MKKTPTIWAKSAALLLFFALLVGFVSYRSIPPSRQAKFQKSVTQWAGLDNAAPPNSSRIPPQLALLLPSLDSTLPEWLDTIRLRELLDMQYQKYVYFPMSKSGRMFDARNVDTFIAYRILEAEYYAPLLTGDEKKMYEQYVEIEPRWARETARMEEDQKEKFNVQKKMEAYEKVRYGTWAYQQLDASDRVRFDALWKTLESHYKHFHPSSRYLFSQTIFQQGNLGLDSILVMRLLKSSK